MNSVRTYANKIQLSQQAADLVVLAANHAIEARGQFTLALAGGSTPRPCYELLAQFPRRDHVDWSRTQVFFGDERSVPADHPDSNYRMACEALLDHVALPAPNIHRMRAEAVGSMALQRAALDYQAEIASAFECEPTGLPPALDLILLGIGDDGHTASIFPETLDSCRGPQWIHSSRNTALQQDRLTFTLPLINAAHHVVFMVAGQGKATVMKRILEEDGFSPPYPAALVQPSHGRLTFLLDEEAASLLE